MRKVGLTGNIGSGKTTVCRLFELLGVPVYYADKRAREITHTPQVLEQILKAFGPQVFDKEMVLNRKKLAEIVFGDKEKLSFLNSLIHPRVYKDYQDWLLNISGHQYCIQESAIMFETGHNKNFDTIIVVSAQREQRIQRVCERDNVSREAVEQRIDNQMDQQMLIKMADFVISNDNNVALIPQVLKVNEILTR